MRSGAKAAAAAMLTLAACSSPSLKYVGREPDRAVVEGRGVDVYARPSARRDQIDVQAIFVDSVFGVHEADLREDAADAIGQVAEGTGCKLDRRSLKGAFSVWEGRLRC